MSQKRELEQQFELFNCTQINISNKALNYNVLLTYRDWERRCYTLCCNTTNLMEKYTVANNEKRRVHMIDNLLGLPPPPVENTLTKNKINIFCNLH